MWKCDSIILSCQDISGSCMLHQVVSLFWTLLDTSLICTTFLQEEILPFQEFFHLQADLGNWRYEICTEDIPQTTTSMNNVGKIWLEVISLGGIYTFTSCLFHTACIVLRKAHPIMPQLLYKLSKLLPTHSLPFFNKEPFLLALIWFPNTLHNRHNPPTFAINYPSNKW